VWRVVHGPHSIGGAAEQGGGGQVRGRPAAPDLSQRPTWERRRHGGSPHGAGGEEGDPLQSVRGHQLQKMFGAVRGSGRRTPGQHQIRRLQSPAEAACRPFSLTRPVASAAVIEGVLEPEEGNEAEAAADQQDGEGLQPHSLSTAGPKVATTTPCETVLQRGRDQRDAAHAACAERRGNTSNASLQRTGRHPHSAASQR
jgi:hypothetical protein